MIRWMRRVLVPQWPLWTTVVVYLTMILFDRLWGTRPPEGFWRIRGVVLYGGAFVYGVVRIAQSHPVLKSDYRDWLRASPWTPGAPLPFAPVHWVWQDAVVGAVLAGAGLVHGAGPILPLAACFEGAFAALCVVFLVLRMRRWGHFALFSLGWLPALASYPLLLGGVLAATYLVLLGGIRESLRRFPWEQGPDWLDSALTQAFQKSSGESICRTGWPHDYLAPEGISRFSPSIGFEAAAWTGLNFAWLLFAATQSISADDERFMAYFAAAMVCFILCPGIRLVIYGSAYQSPLTFLGRLATFRWIVPRFDKVFVGPVLVALTGFLGIGLTLAGRRGWPTRTQGACLCAICGVCLFLVLVFPPTLRNWMLTGGHAIHPSLRRPEFKKSGG